jgi:LPS-assembly protein
VGAGPVELRAREIRGRPDLDATARRQVELKRGALELQADWLSYEQAQDLAVARGAVRVSNATGRYTGTELQLQLQRFEGFFLQPSYEFDRVKAGGRAQRIDFLDSKRSIAQGGWYTSCPRDDLDASATGPGGSPAWVMKTDRVQLDFEPTKASPKARCCASWACPSWPADAELSRSTTAQVGLAAADDGLRQPQRPRAGRALLLEHRAQPRRDAHADRVSRAAALGLDGPSSATWKALRGRVQCRLLPFDRVAGRSRWACGASTMAVLPAMPAAGTTDGCACRTTPGGRTSRRTRAARTPRCCRWPAGSRARPVGRMGPTLVYAALRWQVLQGSDVPVGVALRAAPQLGLQRVQGRLPLATARDLQYTLQTEVNRFVLPDRDGSTADPTTGWRAHVLARCPALAPARGLGGAKAVGQPGQLPHWTSHDRRPRSASRVIPSFSVEAGLDFERDTTLFGRALRQTLEPRALYVNTPFRDQTGCPTSTRRPRTSTSISIFSDNAFSGVDRVSDAHQVTAGVTTRLLDAATGAEALRLGVAQRYLLRTSGVTPDGVPLHQRFSDVLLGWPPRRRLDLDAAVQYSPTSPHRCARCHGALTRPAPSAPVGTTYRFTRG